MKALKALGEIWYGSFSHMSCDMMTNCFFDSDELASTADLDLHELYWSNDWNSCCRYFFSIPANASKNVFGKNIAILESIIRIPSIPSTLFNSKFNSARFPESLKIYLLSYEIISHFSSYATKVPSKLRSRYFRSKHNERLGKKGTNPNETQVRIYRWCRRQIV